MRRVLPFFAVLSFAFAPAPFPKLKPLSDELKAIQGAWVPVKDVVWFRWHGCWGGSSILRGEGPPSDKIPWVIEGDRLTWRSHWAISVNSKKDPPEIDLVRVSPLPAFRRHGLYKLEGDTLIVSMSESTRPKKLEGSKDEEGSLVIYKRQKP